MPGNFKDIQAVSWDSRVAYRYSIESGPQSVLAKEMFDFLGVTVTEADLHNEACAAFKTWKISGYGFPMPIDLLMIRCIGEAQSQAARAAKPPVPPKPFQRKDTLRTEAFLAIAQEFSGKLAAGEIKRVRTTDSASSGD